MGVYGPFTAVLDTVVPVTGIDPNADRLVIDNQSKYTLAVAFGNQAPPAVLTLNGRPWFAEIPTGRMTVPIPADAIDGPFPGTFWVMALDPQNPSRAYTGTVSANTAFFVQALLPREPAPADYAIPQAVDAASQQRVIAVPISLGAGNNYTGLVGTPATGSSANIGGTAGFAAYIGGEFTVYVYYAYISSSTNAAGAGGLDYSLAMDVQTAANVSIGFPWPQVFHRYNADWAAAAGPYNWAGGQFNPHWPVEIPGGLPAGHSIDHLTMVIIDNGSANLPAQLRFSIAWAIGQIYSTPGHMRSLTPIFASATTPVTF